MTLEDELRLTADLVDAATRAGISTPDAKRFCAELAALPLEQAMRICIAAHDERRREQARTRRNER